MVLFTSVVGSYTRPTWLISAVREFRRGLLDADAGIEVLTDGEQGRTNFYEYVAEAARGFRLGASGPPPNPTAIDRVEYGDKRNIARPFDS